MGKCACICLAYNIYRFYIQRPLLIIAPFPKSINKWTYLIQVQKSSKYSKGSKRGKRLYPKGKPGLLQPLSLCTQSHTSQYLQCLCVWNPKGLSSERWVLGNWLRDPLASKPVLISDTGRHCYTATQDSRLQTAYQWQPLLANSPIQSLQSSRKVPHTQLLFPDISVLRKKKQFTGTIWPSTWSIFVNDSCLPKKNIWSPQEIQNIRCMVMYIQRHKPLSMLASGTM